MIRPMETTEPAGPLLKAVEFLEKGEWQSAHEIVQGEKSNLAAWLHGIVHTLEGGLDNARYWYPPGRARLPRAGGQPGGSSRPPAGALHGDRPVDGRAPLREALVHAPHHGHVGVVQALGHGTHLAVAQWETVDGHDRRDLVAAAAEEGLVRN